MLGRLTKLSKNENALRTSDIIGNFTKLPTIGESFVIVNDKPLNTLGSNRVVWTSIVKEISSKEENKYEITTENSVYLLEVYEN